MTESPNQPHSAKSAIVLRGYYERQWRGCADAGRCVATLYFCMSADLEMDCRTALTTELQRQSSSLVSALRAIIHAEQPQDTYLFRFEYDSPAFADTFPVMFGRMNRSGHAEEVRKLLPDLSFAIAPKVIYDSRYEQADLDTWALASEVFIPWFADCWEAVGGHRSRWAGYLAHHDSIYSIDLTTRRELRSPEPRYPDA